MGVFICRKHEDYEYYHGSCSECDRLHLEWENNRLRAEIEDDNRSIKEMKERYEELRAELEHCNRSRKGRLDRLQELRDELAAVERRCLLAEEQVEFIKVGWDATCADLATERRALELACDEMNEVEYQWRKIDLGADYFRKKAGEK